MRQFLACCSPRGVFDFPAAREHESHEHPCDRAHRGTDDCPGGDHHGSDEPLSGMVGAIDGKPCDAPSHGPDQRSAGRISDR
jgi:hypothetical protein